MELREIEDECKKIQELLKKEDPYITICISSECIKKERTEECMSVDPAARS